MQDGLKFRSEVVWSIAALLLVALLPLAAAGCGGEDTRRADAGAQARRDAPDPYELTLPPAEPETMLESGEPVESIETTPVVAPEPPRPVTYAEAESAFLESRYDEAVELFASYTDRRSENPWGYYMLGLSAWKAGDNLHAEDSFDRALELDPTHVKSWLNLGRVLLDEGRAEEALEMIDEALALEPESSVGFRLQGRAYHQRGLLDDAVDSYRQAILIDDSDEWSMNNMGLVLIEQERFDEALPPLARAAELAPDNAIFHNNLGVALERTGHYRAAEDVFRSVLAIDETYVKAEISLLRVEELKESPDVLPVDLAELARSFVDEVEGWRESVAYREWPDWVELDPVIVSSADTTTVDAVQAPVDTVKVEESSGEGGSEEGGHR